MSLFDRIRIIAPGPGTCRVCGAKHAENEGHDLTSLYYINRFWHRWKRLPTEEDAAAEKRLETKKE